MSAEHETPSIPPAHEPTDADTMSDYRKDAVVCLILYLVVPYIGTYVALATGDPGRFELLAHLSIYVWIFDLVGVHPAFVTTTLGIYGAAAPLAVLVHYLFLQASKRSAPFKRAHERLFGAGFCVLMLECRRFRPRFVDQWSAAMETPVFHSAATASLSLFVSLVAAMEVLTLAYLAYGGLIALWRLPLALVVWIVGRLRNVARKLTITLSARFEPSPAKHVPGDVAFWATFNGKDPPSRRRSTSIVRAIQAQWPRIAERLAFTSDRTVPIDGWRFTIRVLLTAFGACFSAEIARLTQVGDGALPELHAMASVAMFAHSPTMHHDMSLHLATQTLASPLYLHAWYRRAAPAIRRETAPRLRDTLVGLLCAVIFGGLLYLPMGIVKTHQREPGWLTSLFHQWYGFYSLYLMILLMMACSGVLHFTLLVAQRWRLLRDRLRASGW